MVIKSVLSLLVIVIYKLYNLNNETAESTRGDLVPEDVPKAEPAYKILANDNRDPNSYRSLWTDRYIPSDALNSITELV